MRSTHAMGVTATVLAVLAGAGCSGGSSHGGASVTVSPPSNSTAAGPVAPHTSTATTSPVSRAPATTSVPSSNDTAAGAPGVPEAARQHTEAGAVAFAKHYLNLINETAISPKTGVLEPLATSSCKSCDNYESTVRGLVKNNRRFSGPELTIKRISNIGFQGSSANIEAHVSELPVKILEANNRTVKSFPPREDDGVVFELSWQYGWKVAAVRAMSK